MAELSLSRCAILTAVRAASALRNAMVVIGLRRGIVVEDLREGRRIRHHIKRHAKGQDKPIHCVSHLLGHVEHVLGDCGFCQVGHTGPRGDRGNWWWPWAWEGSGATLKDAHQQDASQPRANGENSGLEKLSEGRKHLVETKTDSQKGRKSTRAAVLLPNGVQ